MSFRRLAPLPPAVAAPLVVAGLARLPPLDRLHGGWRQLAVEALLSACTLAIVAGFGWWREAGLGGPWQRRPLSLILLGFLLLQWLLSLPALLTRGQWSALPLVLALVALVGFSEETLVRGVVLASLRPFGPLAAGLVSAALFAALHLLNLLSSLSPAYVGLQVGNAFLVGLLFAALRLRMGLLWPLVATHALIDLPPLLAGFPAELPPVTPLVAVLSLALLSPFGMTGLGLLLWEQLSPSRPGVPASSS